MDTGDIQTGTCFLNLAGNLLVRNLLEPCKEYRNLVWSSKTCNSLQGINVNHALDDSYICCRSMTCNSHSSLQHFSSTLEWRWRGPTMMDGICCCTSMVASMAMGEIMLTGEFIFQCLTSDTDKCLLNVLLPFLVVLQADSC
jgi:hypothetical protein